MELLFGTNFEKKKRTREKSWPNLRYYPYISVEGRWTQSKASVKIVGVVTKTRTTYFLLALDLPGLTVCYLHT